jgi:hypothetical protein
MVTSSRVCLHSMSSSSSSIRQDAVMASRGEQTVVQLQDWLLWHCYSLQSARLVLLSDLVVRPVLLLALQDSWAPPMLSVGFLALESPPGQKLPAEQGRQLREVPFRDWNVPGGHTAAGNQAAVAAASQ